MEVERVPPSRFEQHILGIAAQLLECHGKAERDLSLIRADEHFDLVRPSLRSRRATARPPYRIASYLLDLDGWYVVACISTDLLALSCNYCYKNNMINKLHSFCKRKPGAGRKAGSTKYGEPTRVIRLPESLHKQAAALLAARIASKPGGNIADITTPYPNAPRSERPLFLSQVAAGFPSPADDHIERRLDLNQYMIQHDAATYFVRVKGDSMIDAGIRDNDVLVVDRSVTARAGCIVVAVVNGELTVKTLGRSKSGQPLLVPANANFAAIEIKDGMSFEVWGVVTGSVRKFK